MVEQILMDKLLILKLACFIYVHHCFNGFTEKKDLKMTEKNRRKKCSSCKFSYCLDNKLLDK